MPTIKTNRNREKSFSPFSPPKYPVPRWRGHAQKKKHVLSKQAINLPIAVVVFSFQASRLTKSSASLAILAITIINRCTYASTAYTVHTVHNTPHTYVVRTYLPYLNEHLVSLYCILYNNYHQSRYHMYLYCCIIVLLYIPYVLVLWHIVRIYFFVDLPNPR